MLAVYPVVQFLDLVGEAKKGLKAARNKAEQVKLLECAKAIDLVISILEEVSGLLHGYEVRKKE